MQLRIYACTRVSFRKNGQERAKTILTKLGGEGSAAIAHLLGGLGAFCNYPSEVHFQTHLWFSNDQISGADLTLSTYLRIISGFCKGHTGLVQYIRTYNVNKYACTYVHHTQHGCLIPASLYKYICTYVHLYIHTLCPFIICLIETLIRTCIRVSVHICTCTYIPTYAYVHTHKHTYIHTTM